MQDALTPMMQQYRRLRSSIPGDTLLLFRLGDFYELFFEDAKEAAGLLNVALTKRNGLPGSGGFMLLAGKMGYRRVTEPPEQSSNMPAAITRSSSGSLRKVGEPPPKCSCETGLPLPSEAASLSNSRACNTFSISTSAGALLLLNRP